MELWLTLKLIDWFCFNSGYFSKPHMASSYGGIKLPGHSRQFVFPGQAMG